MGSDNSVHESVVAVDATRSGGSSASEATLETADVADATLVNGSNENHPDDPLDHRHNSAARNNDTDSGSMTELEHDADEDDHDSSPPTPRFMQDEGVWKHWRWVPYPVRRMVRATVRWSRGPPDARPHKITPLLPAVQLAPILALERLVDVLTARMGGGHMTAGSSGGNSGSGGGGWRWLRHRWVWRRTLYFGWLGLWLLTFALVLRRGLLASEIAGWGTPSDIGCGNTYWVPGNQCGLDGNDCRPFSGSGFAFRCPSTCESYIVLNPRAVGSQEIVYETLVIGGPGSGNASFTDSSTPLYRGDSFLCSAAIHAGVVTNANGGCGVVQLQGRQSNFVASSAHGIQSVGFDSYFPLSFSFVDGIECPAQDSRWPLLAISVPFTVVIGLFTARPGPFFWAVFTGIFWTVGLATDPVPAATIADQLSAVLGRFLPAALGAWVIYDVSAVRRTLTGLTAHIEKTVLWLGACWVGALTNYTFDYIPIQRLTPHDLQQQPGAKAALSIIVIVLLVIVASQIWFFQQEGRLRNYLKLYILFCGALLLCVPLPQLNLRIHHYILALLLLPGTSMQTRPALLYQGLLVGLYINGTCRWGFASLLQTPSALQGDAQLGSPLPQLIGPVIRMANATAAVAIASLASAAAAISGGSSSDLATAIAAANSSSITFSWQPPPGPRYDGVSVLVNDVERYRGFFDDGESGNEFVWERQPATADEPAQNEYFRFAYLEGSDADDYTKAGIWTADGDWIAMEAGPSRVRSRSLDGETRRGE